MARKYLKPQREETKFLGVTPPINSLYLLKVKFCSYKVRGLNKKSKHDYVKNVLLENHISFVGLVETRVKHHKSF